MGRVNLSNTSKGFFEITRPLRGKLEVSGIPKSIIIGQWNKYPQSISKLPI